MKKVKDILENYSVRNCKTQIDSDRMSLLCEAGLFDENTLRMAKRAYEKSPSNMTMAEKTAILEVTDALLTALIVEKKDHLAAFDKKASKAVSEKDMPTIIILKRKAIRVFPDNQKIGLYYSQALDKYVSIPFGPSDKHSGTHLNEALKMAKDRSKAVPVIGNEEEEDKDKPPPERPSWRVNRALGKPAIFARLSALPNREDRGDIRQFILAAAARDPATAAGVAAGTLIARVIHGVRFLAHKSGGIIAGRVSEKLKARKTAPGEAHAPPESHPILPDASSLPLGLKLPSKNSALRSTQHPTGLVSRPTSTGERPVPPPVNRPVRTFKENLEMIREQASPRPPGAAVGGTLRGRPLQAPEDRPGAVGVRQNAQGQNVVPGPTPLQAAETGLALSGAGPALTAARGLVRGARAVAGGVGSFVARRRAAAAAAGAGAAGAAGASASKLFDTDIFKDTKINRPGFTDPGRRGPDISASQTAVVNAALQRLPGGPNVFGSRLAETSVISQAKELISEGTDEKVITIKESTINLHKSVAKKLIKVYESLNNTNRKKFEKMLNEDAVSFKKALQFALRN